MTTAASVAALGASTRCTARASHRTVADREPKEKMGFHPR